MGYEVLLTEDAVRDLEEIDAYIVSHEGEACADEVIGGIEDGIRALEELPERGRVPPELASLGIREYREVFFKPYRIVYGVRGRRVFVYLVVDGRRDLQGLLARRLLRT